MWSPDRALLRRLPQEGGLIVVGGEPGLGKVCRRMGFAPTGRTEEEHWGIPDQLGLLLQLGVVSLPKRG